MRYHRILCRASIASALALASTACNDTATPTTTLTTEVASVSKRGSHVDYVQEDRFGKPAIATVFISTSMKNAFNTAAPERDVADYTSAVVNVLTSFGHPNPTGLAAALLPDVQPINTSAPTTFLNGRRLQDDVITAELGLIFRNNAALNDDHVDANDKPFLNTFPYLAAPHVQ